MGLLKVYSYRGGNNIGIRLWHMLMDLVRSVKTTVQIIYLPSEILSYFCLIFLLSFFSPSFNLGENDTGIIPYKSSIRQSNKGLN